LGPNGSRGEEWITGFDGRDAWNTARQMWIKGFARSNEASALIHDVSVIFGSGRPRDENDCGGKDLHVRRQLCVNFLDVSSRESATAT